MAAAYLYLQLSAAPNGGNHAPLPDTLHGCLPFVRLQPAGRRSIGTMHHGRGQLLGLL
jgi:hypothetical protein